MTTEALVVVPRPGWHDRAACRGLPAAWFFPERGGSIAAAAAVCRCCAVREDSLGYALAHGVKFGVWGGLSEKQRKRIRARRRAAR